MCHTHRHVQQVRIGQHMLPLFADVMMYDCIIKAKEQRSIKSLENIEVWYYNRIKCFYTKCARTKFEIAVMLWENRP